MNKIKILYIGYILVFTTCESLLDSHRNDFVLQNIDNYIADDFEIYSDLKVSAPIFINISELEDLVLSYDDGDEQAKLVVDQLFLRANQILELPPPSVTNRAKIYPANSPNDYVSLAPYWWPSKNENNEIQYTRIDGERNPELYEYNRDELSNFRHSLVILAIADYVSDDDVYFLKAEEFLETWFVNPATKMNPHLSHAQFIPGINGGRFLGIIEGIEFIKVLDSIYFLQKNDSWNDSLNRKIGLWYHEFNEWLRNSNFGKAERNYFNNHGSWYDVQIASYSQALSNYSAFTTVLDSVGSKRINKHILEDGSQPFELVRSNSLHYSLYNLEALLLLARFDLNNEYGIWEYPSATDSRLQEAINYLEPYFIHNKDWDYQQETEIDICRYIRILNIALDLSNNEYYYSIREQLINSSCSEWQGIEYLISN